MSLSPLEKLNNPVAAPQTQPPSQDALRRVAAQFEAILLMQLTSALSGSNDDGEDSLFGGDGGTGLAKKMFSEQMATAMAEAGGIGLADVIMKSFGVNEAKSADNKLNPLQKTISTVNEIRNSAVRENSNIVPAKEVAETTNPIVSPTKIVAENTSASSTSLSFQLPANGRISSNFGSRFHPIDKKIKFHGGIDVAVPTGTRVNSAADGVVEFAGRRGGYGNLVIVRHADGRETRYAHLDKILVAVGDPVSGGQEIAKSGSTGKSTGPHLHFEVRENGQVVNPMKILSNVVAIKNR
jgi:murein DD-endopeptidase MepM/ murein hydrolase activator NlpD